MRYTLNDIKYDPFPLTEYTPDPDYTIDDEALKVSFKKNRELTERLFQQFEERKRTNQRIV